MAMAALLARRSTEDPSSSVLPSPGSEDGEDTVKVVAREEELPMVFLCAGCKRAVGDTLDWEANEEKTRCLFLRSVSPTVAVDKEQKLSSWPGERGCYTLGSAEQKADVDEEPLTLESQAILEESLEKAEATLKALEHRLSLVESGLASLPNND